MKEEFDEIEVVAFAPKAKKTKKTTEKGTKANNAAKEETPAT